MLEKLLEVLTRVAVALEALASGDGTTDAKAPGKPRGRKAVGEANGVALTPEQVAAQIAGASSASSAAAASTVSTATAVTTAGPAGDLPAVVTQPTLQQVADAIIALVNSPTGGRDKAVSILTANGVKKVPELKPDQYAAVLAAVTAAAAPPTSAAGLV